MIGKIMFKSTTFKIIMEKLMINKLIMAKPMRNLIYNYKHGVCAFVRVSVNDE